MTSAVIISESQHFPLVRKDSIQENNRWEVKSQACSRDLLIKKVALGALVVLNMAFLTAVAFSILFTTRLILPIPVEALVLIPFFAGILSTFSFLGIPTGEITKSSVTEMKDPQVMLGKTVSFILFSPVVWAVRNSDWTEYHNPHEANRISYDLENLSIKEFSEKYQKKIDSWNLAKYGFVSESDQAELRAVMGRYAALSKTQKTFLDHHGPAIEKREKESLFEDPRFEFLKSFDEIHGQLETCERTWRELQTRLSVHLPHPLIPSVEK